MKIESFPYQLREPMCLYKIEFKLIYQMIGKFINV